MSDRGTFRGRGGGRSGGGGDHRGARGGGRGGAHGGPQTERPKKENILDLTKYMDKEITVKFNGGREGWSASLLVTVSLLTKRTLVVGTLKGYDQLMNLVLDDVKELLRGELAVYCDYRENIADVRVADDEGNESSRSLGLIVARGTLLVLISPLDGSEQIENPFNQVED